MRFSMFMILFSFLFSACGSFINPSGIDRTAVRYARKIARGEKVEGPAIGKVGIKSKQYQYYEQMLAHTSEKDLIKLTKHPDPKVSCYVFKGVVEKKSDACFAVLKDRQKGLRKLKFHSGCIIQKITVIDYMLHESYPIKNQFSTAQKQFIEELEQKRLTQKNSF